MPSLNRHLGEFVIDHSASPGTPEVPEGTILERPHFTCPHCGGVVLMNAARARDRHYCPKCDHWTCDTPGCVVECNPIQRSAELVLLGVDKATILRGPRGELLYDATLHDKTRIY